MSTTEQRQDRLLTASDLAATLGVSRRWVVRIVPLQLCLLTCLNPHKRAPRQNCSHGQERGPIEIRFSIESRYQPAEVTWLSSLA